MSRKMDKSSNGDRMDLMSHINDTILIIFDYDWSLVNDNSDTYIFKQLYPELLNRIMDYQGTISWTNLMDSLLQSLAIDKPDITADIIKTTLANIPVQDGMIQALQLAVSRSNTTVKIISDANTVYINAMLEKYGLDSDIIEVFTNPAAFGSDQTNPNPHQLHVKPYHSAEIDPHNCEHCPANMCKGSILASILEKKEYSRVLYVGDGTGDFCPSTRLKSQDIVFPRLTDPVTQQKFGLYKKLQANEALIQAQIIPWSVGDEIFAQFKLVFANETSS